MAGMIDEDDWDLFADERRFRQHPFKFLGELKSTMTGKDFAAYDNYLGGQLFGLNTWVDRIIDLTVKQPEMRKTIDKLVAEQAEREKDWALSPADRAERDAKHQRWIEDRIKNIALKALPRFTSLSAVRFEYFFISQVLSRGYMQGMHISRSDVARLRVKAAECQAKKQSLVLFPCHRSHVDYIALVYTFFRIGLSMPMTIAGDNLDIPVLSWWLRQVGATFIRRGNWKEDPLYTAFFQSLINTYLQQGYNIQCFIEGTRSRSGKLLPPKYGILKFILEAVMSGSVDDAWIVPVSTQYDKVFEGDAYATELMGHEKKKESLMSFFESRSVVKVNLGRIDIRFSEGFSLRQFVSDQVARNLPKPVILRSLAYRVLDAINDTSVVMPSALVGTVLLTTRQRGLSLDDMVVRVRRLISRIVARGGRIGAIAKPPLDLTNEEIRAMVDNAIDVLGADLVTVETKRVLETVCHPKDELKLSYYRNQVVHLFVSEAIVCVCLYRMYAAKLDLTVNFKELERRVFFLSKLLSGEFVFNTDDGLDANLQATLGRLKAQNIIADYDEASVSISIDEVRSEWMQTHNYTYLVWPFIDGYWSAAMALLVLPPRAPMNYKQFLTTAQHIANTLYAEGALTHVEACSRELIQSAIGQSVARGLVIRDKSTITVVADQTALSNLSDDIAEYRNEVMKRAKGSDTLERVQGLIGERFAASAARL